ncbi:MAG: MiaB/RimO family radical SAM methylthiotransferase, partial [Candidatus Aegiribacteria sp.]|nr:MiaB/RimO family radical SAM methylthiotransferase [Candidatus Aegiribacteria sp.]
MKYYMDVYGCQMNVHDSEIIEGILQSRDMQPADSPEKAEAILLVSCAVREHAETRVLGRAAQLGGMYRCREEGKPVIVLCGCVAQEHGETLLEQYRDLDLVVGPDCYNDLPDLIEKVRERSSVFRTSVTDFRRCDYTGAKPVRREHPRSFVTIMRGCDNFCSYCIVPYVRGRERSRRPEEIIAEVEELREQGYGEITLLGQNVNSYTSEGMDFAALLKRVSKAAGTSWVRFVTSHPKDLDEKIASVMSSRRNVCRQLHLPLQSGSSRILKKMNRGYTAEQYRSKIAMLRN